ncbi:hypothetical protein ACLHZT_18840, partial [Aeromonas veronii]|uniref:hypothetical protein n=1 Tax=Aeromonas veronii TaxID=654 RepID=UPI003D009270
MLLDRFTGNKLKLNDLPGEIISGRYQVEQQPLQYQRHFELEVGQLLLNDGSGRWHCGPVSGTYFQQEQRSAEAKTANSTSKCDTRLCRLTVLFEYLDRL